MKYISIITLLTVFNAFCVSEDSKAPTDYYELDAVYNEANDLDDEWVFRVYNGKDPVPPQFSKQQAAAIRGKE